MSQRFNFVVPPNNQDEFGKLPLTVQREVEQWLTSIERILKAENIAKGIHNEVAIRRGVAGFSYQRIEAKTFLFKRAQGDWRVLINLKKCPRHIRINYTERTDLHATGMPKAFVDYWQGLFLANQRKGRPAWRELIRRWKAGDEIPGYGTWREYWQRAHPGVVLGSHCPPDLPSGWGYRNLTRHKPENADIALARKGIAAAREFLPQVIRTRVGIRPLEYIVYDDLWHDFDVIVDGHEHPVRLLELACMDVATGMKLRGGLLPVLPGANGVEQRLRAKHMKLLVCGLLDKFGVPEGYVSHHIMERGTATLFGPDALALEQLTGGRVKCHWTTMIGGQVLIGGHADGAKGNSWGKAWIESSHNLRHNETAALPGQVGRNYTECPAELAGRTKDAEALLKAAQHLTPAQRAALKLPFPKFAEASQFLAAVELRIAHLTDHEMEGFDDVAEWRFSDLQPWQSSALLVGVPPEVQQTLQWRSRKESRMERFTRLMALEKFTRFSRAMLPRFMEDHQQVTVGDQRIVFKRKGTNYLFEIPEPHPQLKDGSEFLAYFDDQDMEWIHLVRTDGGYVASVKRVHAPRFGDAAALVERQKVAKRAMAAAIGRVQKRQIATGDAERQVAAMEDNARVFEEAAELQLAQAPDHLDERDAPQVVRDLNAAVAGVGSRKRDDAKRKREERANALLAEAAIAARAGGGE